MTVSPDRLFRIRRTHLLQLLTLIVLLLLGISSLSFQTRAAGVGLDDSWERSISYFAQKHMQAGTDYVFTYGPLGYLDAPVFNRALFWSAFWFEIIMKILLVYFLWRLSKPHSKKANEARATEINTDPKNLSLKLFCFLLLLFCSAPIHLDAKSLFFLTLIAFDLNESSGTGFRRFFDVALLAIFSLRKFTFFIFSFLIVLLTEVHVRKENRKALFSPVFTFGALFCVAWISVGQSLSGIPGFLFGSEEIAVGYNQAMALYGSVPLLILSILILILVLTLILNVFLRLAKDTAATVKLSILAIVFLMSWKHGFVRQDNHMTIFFGYAIFTTLLLILHFAEVLPRKPLHLAVSAVVVYSCLLGIGGTRFGNLAAFPNFKPDAKLSIHWIGKNTDILLHPVLSMAALDEEEKMIQQQWALPLVHSYAQNATIDVISYQQGVVILNQWNWVPRPIFQSYSAYTPYLLRINQKFFRTSPPDYLLYKLQPIDDKFPASDDSLSLLEILSGYKPIAAERGFLLLKKTADRSAPSPGEVTAAQEIQFNQEIRIDPEVRFQTLSLKMEESLWGKIRDLFYKPSIISIRVKTAAGKAFTYRLVPSIAREGFLLTPLLQKTSDVAQTYGKNSGTIVRSFTLLADSPLSVKKNVQMETRSFPRDRAPQLDRHTLELLSDSLKFETAYDSDEKAFFPSLNGGVTIGNYQALLKNGSLETSTITLPAGEYRIVILGYGTEARKVFPKLSVSWNGNKISDFFLKKEGNYETRFQLNQQQEGRLSISFTNDAKIGKEDRDVYIKQVYLTTGP